MKHNCYSKLSQLISNTELSAKDNLLDAVASANAEVIDKISQQQPQAGHDLLTLLLPHVTQVLPASAVVELKPTPYQTRSKHTMTKGMRFKSNSTHPYSFISCYDTEVLPLRVSDARYCETPTGSEVTMTLAALPGVTFATLKLDSFTMYLQGESLLIDTLQVSLLQAAKAVSLCFNGEKYSLPLLQGTYTSPVQGLLPTYLTAQPALHYLLENLYYDERQHFVSINGLDTVNWCGSATELTITVHFDESIPALSQLRHDNIRLNCVPIINLYPQTCEPIMVTAQQQDYPITVDVNNAQCWLYDIVDVTLQDKYGKQQRLTPVSTQGFNITYKKTRLLSNAAYPHYSLSLQNNYDVAPQTAAVAALVHQGNGPYDELYPGVALTAQSGLPNDLQLSLLTRPQRASQALLDDTAIEILTIFLHQHFQSIIDHELLKQLLTLLDVNQRYQTIIANITAINATPLAYCYKGAKVTGFTLHMTVSKSVNDMLSLRKLAGILHRFFCYYADLNTVIVLVVYSQYSDEEYTWQPLLGQKLTL
ncbi:MAG: hypothetical protein CMF50_01470 [Legionellales bacterium]|nr:hypothetical protein [Legionellales bacterium]|tara:strand:+ start:17793 stop:19400 length:1608 start_codon:yes stop_codon:yes gene_type:complete